MTQIRKKSIVVTVYIYIGFAIGALNTLLFANKLYFTQSEYGLTRAMIDVAIMCSAFAAVGVPMYIIKFFPYYNKRLTKQHNDLLGRAILITIIGLVIVIIASIIAQPLVIRKYSGNAPLLVTYFYYTIPITIGYVLYTLLDTYAWNYGLQVYTNVLKEVVVRLIVLILILLYLTNVITLHAFFILFSLQYLVVCVILIIKLNSIGAMAIQLKQSIVSIKFNKQIRSLMLFGFAGSLVGAIKVALDSIILSSIKGLAYAAVYTFVGFAASLLQAPFRSMVSVTFPLLVTAWQQKNKAEIQRLYQRSSINLLLFSIFIFGIIVLNFEHAIYLFHLNENYLTGKNLLYILCIAYIIDLGTGLNGQIIQASTAWRFEFYTNVLLAAILIPFTYYFTVWYGLIGPAIATLIGITVYNIIRIVYLYTKYQFFPFTTKSLWVLITFTALILACTYTNQWLTMWPSLIVTNVLYCTLAMVLVYTLKLSPDVQPVLNTIATRLGLKLKIK